MDLCVFGHRGPSALILETISLGQWPLNISYFLAGSESASARAMPCKRRDEKLPMLPAFVRGTNILCERCPANSRALWMLTVFGFMKACKRPCFLSQWWMSEAGVLDLLQLPLLKALSKGQVSQISRARRTMQRGKGQKTVGFFSKTSGSDGLQFS